MTTGAVSDGGVVMDEIIIVAMTDETIAVVVVEEAGIIEAEVGTGRPPSLNVRPSKKVADRAGRARHLVSGPFYFNSSLPDCSISLRSFFAVRLLPSRNLESLSIYLYPAHHQIEQELYPSIEK